jgi:hypothetical protein
MRSVKPFVEVTLAGELAGREARGWLYFELLARLVDALPVEEIRVTRLAVTVKVSLAGGQPMAELVRKLREVEAEALVELKKERAGNCGACGRPREGAPRATET